MRHAGHRVTVAISRRKETSLAGLRVFDQDVYRSMKRDPLNRIDRQQLRGSVARVCANILPVMAQTRPDVVYAHSVNAVVAEGLLHAIDAIYLPGQKPTLIGELPFPSEPKPSNFYGEQLFDFFGKRKLRHALSGDRVHWMTVNEDTSSLLSGATGGDIGVMPSPYSTASTIASMSRSPVIRIGSVGHQNDVKGFHLLPDAIDRCDSHGKRIQWVIQHQSDSDAVTLKRLRELATRHDIELLSDDLGPNAYENMLLSLDVVLLPYQPQRYVSAISGICYEGIAQGSLVVAPRETTIGKIIRQFQPGTPQFGDWNAQSIAEAMSHCIRDFGLLRKTGIEGSTRYRATNGPDAYVNAITSLAPPDRPILSGGRMSMTAHRAYWAARTLMHC